MQISLELRMRKLVFCPGCQHRISEVTDLCPSCGSSLAAGHLGELALIFGGAIVLVSLLGPWSGVHTRTPAVADSIQTEEREIEEVVQAVTGKSGEVTVDAEGKATIVYAASDGPVGESTKDAVRTKTRDIVAGIFEDERLKSIQDLVLEPECAPIDGGEGGPLRPAAECELERVVAQQVRWDRVSGQRFEELLRSKGRFEWLLPQIEGTTH
jgi:hypothetical protein